MTAAESKKLQELIDLNKWQRMSNFNEKKQVETWEQQARNRQLKIDLR